MHDCICSRPINIFQDDAIWSILKKFNDKGFSSPFAAITTVFCIGLYLGFHISCVSTIVFKNNPMIECVFTTLQPCT